MEKLLKRDITVIVVSHDLKFVQQWCKKAIWLEKGQIKFSGSAEETTEHYLSSIGKKK
jgi:lipopolysaccharide transport system ATP-binding protein